MKMQIQVSERNRKTVLPIRLQAYERLALLLERISPESITMRVSKPGMTAKQLHTEPLGSIRAEFDHNMSQQIFEMTLELKNQPTREAIQFLKKEMEQFF